MGPCIANIVQYISNKMQLNTVYYIWKLLYMFRVLLPPIIRSAYNCIYSIWYLSHLYYYLSLSWKSWNWFERANIVQYISNKMQLYTVYYIWKLLYVFRVLLPTIIRSAYNCIYSIWYLSHRYCYLSLSWKSWSWFECAVGGVHHPQVVVTV